MCTITIDFEKTVGPIKPMHAVNNGPIKAPSTQTRGNFETWVDAGIPYARNHDASFFSEYGGEHTVDVWAIFPNPDADVNDPASYDFALTDRYIQTTLEAGTKIFYRLGSKIEHWVKKYGTRPPKDFQTWAGICEHIILHYNEGWADGFFYNIEYWEIWNEPDLGGNPSPTWSGTKKQFFDLYEITAKRLKTRFPSLKIGGPALAGDLKWAEAFLTEMHARNVPLDFFSWHIYCTEPTSLANLSVSVHALLQRTGYGNAESICNEWNYVLDWQSRFVESLSTIPTMKGAAFIASCMLLGQSAPLDMLMYYDASPGIWNGMYDTRTLRPLKGYYPFKMFRTLYDLGTAAAVSCNDPQLHAAAAKDDDGQHVHPALLLHRPRS